MGGAAIENSIENSSEKQIGPPRLPQAISITARKVPATSTPPSSRSSWRVSCTSMNNGVPSTGAGSTCMSLRRRGEGTSGRLVMMTPTAALAAAAKPADSKSASMMSTSPSATLKPLVTYWLKATRSAFWALPWSRAASVVKRVDSGGFRFMAFVYTLPNPCLKPARAAKEPPVKTCYRTMPGRSGAAGVTWEGQSGLVFTLSNNLGAGPERDKAGGIQ